MVEKRFMRVKISELVPYENNPRNIPEEVDIVQYFGLNYLARKRG